MSRGRQRVNFVKCNYPDCEELRVNGRMRCTGHNAWKLEAAKRGERPPHPTREYVWCDPCQAYFPEMLHVPRYAPAFVSD